MHDAGRIVGRESELAWLRVALRDTRSRGAAVAIDGEQGAGKTRLLAELCVQARALGREVHDVSRGAPPSRQRLEERARHVPQVVVLDAAERADAAVSDAVAGLLADPPRLAVLVVVAGRLGQVVGRLRRVLADVDVLRLGPLDVTATGALLEDLGSDRDAEEAAGRTAGNPWAIVQVARSRAAVPSTVAAAVAAELEALPPPARALAIGAAIAGDPFALPEAEVAAGLDGAVAAAARAPLRATGLVSAEADGGRWVFRSPLVHDATLVQATGAERRAGHRRLAGHLAAIGADAAIRAPHALRGGRRDWATTMTLAQAGMDVLDLAPARAATWLAAALDHVGDRRPRTRSALLMSVAFTHAAAGRYEQACDCLDEAAVLHPRALGYSVRAALWCGLEQLLGRHHRARALIEQQLAAGAPDRASRLLLELVRLSCLMYALEFEEAGAALRPLIAEARVLGDPQLELEALGLGCLIEVECGHPREAAAHLRQGAAVAATMSDRQHAARPAGLYYLAYGAYFNDRCALAVQLFSQALDIHRACGRQPFEFILSLGLALSLTAVGRLGEARAVVEAAHLIAERETSAQSRAWLALTESTVAAAEGRTAEAVRRAGAAHGLRGELEGEVMRASAAWARANAAAAAGDAAAICAVFAEWIADGDLHRIALGQRAHCAELLVRAALWADDLPQARHWAGRAATYAAGCEQDVAHAAAGVALARVALAEQRCVDARAHAATAGAAAVRSGRPVLAAECRALEARAALTGGDVHGARALLEPVHARALRMGAGAVACEAVELLRECGGRPAVLEPGSARAHLARLTDRQREIVALVAVGSSNRAIAEALSLSVRTVEGHVAAIRGVLGVRSRAAIAAAAATTPAADGAALTPRERDVARLVAAGHANHEIAAALSVSVKTVERQLSGCYRKLGIPGRTALAAWAAASDGAADPLLPWMQS